MEGVPIIIFSLLFFLVLILIGLDRSNKKFADKVSVLEQTVELKAESLSSMKEIYAQSQVVLQESEEQQKELTSKKEIILELKDNKASLEQVIDKQAEQMQQLEYVHNQVIEEATQKIIKIEKDLILKNDVSNELKKEYLLSMKKAEERSISLLQSIAEKELFITSIKQEQKIMKEKNLQEQQDFNKTIKNKESHITELLNLQKEEEKKNKKIFFELSKKEESQKIKIELLEFTYAKSVEQSKEVQSSLEYKLENLNVTHEEMLQENRLKQENIIEKQRQISKLKQVQQDEEESKNNIISSLSETISSNEISILELKKMHKSAAEVAKSEIAVVVQAIESKEEAIGKLEEKNMKVKEENIILKNTMKDKSEAMIQMETIQVKSMNEIKNTLRKAEDNLANQERTLFYMRENHEETKKHTQDTILILKNNLKEKQEDIKKLKNEHVNHLQTVDKETILIQKNAQEKETIWQVFKEGKDKKDKKNKENIVSLEDALEKRNQTILELNEMQEEIAKETVLQISVLEKSIKAKDDRLKILEKEKKYLQQSTDSKYVKMENELLESNNALSDMEQGNRSNNKVQEKKMMDLEENKKIQEISILNLQTQHAKNAQKSKEFIQKLERALVQKEDEILRLANVRKTTQIDMKKFKDKSIAITRKKEPVDINISQADIITYIQQGKSKEDVAKKFGIPLKRVELIMKFDKIKKENQSIS